jgi:HAD superfamily hydrolase (TIGR01509 family)
VLRALIWDLDGTLAETEEQGHRPAFNQAFAEAGLAWQWDEAVYGELLAIAGGKERLAAWWQRIDPAGAASPGAADLIARLHAAKTRHYVRRVEQGALVLRPGVQRLLRQAADAGLLLAMATTTSPANVAVLLAATPGAPAVQAWACIGAGDVVPNKKPAPDIYHWVLERLGLRADEALAIEDSAIGARAAVAAGLQVVVGRSRYTRGDALPPVLADLDGLGEPGQPALGSVFDRAAGAAAGRRWQGAVTLQALQAWFAAATAPPPPRPPAR